MSEKKYYYRAVEIVRTDHYVDAHHHYDYTITRHTGFKKVCPTLEAAKKYIRTRIYHEEE